MEARGKGIHLAVSNAIDSDEDDRTPKSVAGGLKNEASARVLEAMNELNSISPDLWQNIPKCVCKAIELLISEMNHV